jgi:hypothetical protein
MADERAVAALATLVLAMAPVVPGCARPWADTPKRRELIEHSPPPGHKLKLPRVITGHSGPTAPSAATLMAQHADYFQAGDASSILVTRRCMRRSARQLMLGRGPGQGWRLACEDAAVAGVVPQHVPQDQHGPLSRRQSRGIDNASMRKAHWDTRATVPGESKAIHTVVAQAGQAECQYGRIGFGCRAGAAGGAG